MASIFSHISTGISQSMQNPYISFGAGAATGAVVTSILTPSAPKPETVTPAQAATAAASSVKPATAGLTSQPQNVSFGPKGFNIWYVVIPAAILALILLCVYVF